VNGRRVVYLSTAGVVGGAERDLLEVVAAVREARPAWRLGVVLGAEGPLRGAVEALGVDCRVVPLPGAVARLGDAGLRGAGGLLRLAAGAAAASGPAAAYLARLRRALASWAPARVQTNDMKAHLLGAWATPRGVPVCWYLQDYPGPRPAMARLLRAAARARGGRRLAPVAISAAVAADAAAVLGRPVPAVEPAVDLREFAPEGPADDLDAASGLPPAPAAAVRVGLVAAFARWKGHEVFLEAVARLGPAAPARFYVVGGPIYRRAQAQYSLEELRDRARALGAGDRVGFTGHRADPAAALRALDVVVHASTRPEPFGRVIAEAMACGRPVVAARDSGALGPDPASGAALALPGGDPAALAATLALLIADADLRRRLGAAGRRAAVARFDRAALARRWMTVYSGTR
jgi:hypothetical protein